jgi:hypothetical protein
MSGAKLTRSTALVWIWSSRPLVIRYRCCSSSRPTGICALPTVMTYSWSPAQGAVATVATANIYGRGAGEALVAEAREEVPSDGD